MFSGNSSWSQLGKREHRLLSRDSPRCRLSQLPRHGRLTRARDEGPGCGQPCKSSAVLYCQVILTAVAGRLWVGTTCGVTPGNDVPANNMRQPCGKQHGDIRHAVHGMRGGGIEHGALQ